jgi:multidrug resistance efflux pump
MITQKVHPAHFARLLPTVPARPTRRLSWQWIVLLASLLASLAAVGFSLRPGRGDAGEVRPTGLIKEQEVRLASRIGGRVAAVHVQAGQQVEAGQVLVTFEAQELTARRDQAQSRLAAAQAALERGKHGPLSGELEEAKAAAAGARARYERVQAGVRPEQKRQAKDDLDDALAAQRHADEDFARTVRLVSQGAASRKEYEEARANRDRAHHRADAAQATYDMALQGGRPEDIAEAKAEFDRLQAHYELLRRGTRDEDQAAARAAVALAQAQLAEVEATLRETVVTAAEPCVIVEVLVRPGSVVAAGQAVVVAH